MIITEVTTIKLRCPMPVPMADAIHYMPDRPALLVQVHTDDGRVGLGEAAAYGGFLESTESLITGAGLTPSVVTDPVTDPAQDGIVQSTDPAPGSDAQSGDVVIIHVGQFQQGQGTTTTTTP